MIYYILSQWQGDIDGLPPLTLVVGVLLRHYRCRKLDPNIKILCLGAVMQEAWEE